MEKQVSPNSGCQKPNPWLLRISALVLAVSLTFELYLLFLLSFLVIIVAGIIFVTDSIMYNKKNPDRKIEKPNPIPLIISCFLFAVSVKIEFTGLLATTFCSTIILAILFIVRRILYTNYINKHIAFQKNKKEKEADVKTPIANTEDSVLNQGKKENTEYKENEEYKEIKQLFLENSVPDENGSLNLINLNYSRSTELMSVY